MHLDGIHALLITPDHKVVLQQKTQDYSYDSANAGKLAIYGGGIEDGETIEAALQRELKEELGLDLPNYEYKKLGLYRKTLSDDGVAHDVHVFVVDGVNPTDFEIRSGDAENASTPEIDSIEGHLKNPNLTRITRLALQDYSSAK